jgi:hypothetical protein
MARCERIRREERRRMRRKRRSVGRRRVSGMLEVLLLMLH